jgi:hypothetical protein
MANYELIGLNEAGPDLRAPTAADTGVVVGGLSVAGAIYNAAGTANGVVYLNGSKAQTSGTGFLFDPSSRVLINSSGAASYGSMLEVTSNSSTQAVAIFGRASDNLAEMSFHPNASATVYATLRSGPTYLATRIAGTEKTRIDSDGLKFNGDTAAANALDDYEEGTFTVGVFDATSGGNQSATTATGYYTKIGRVVTVTLRIDNISTVGMTAGNVLAVSLPFAALADTQNTGSVILDTATFSGSVIPIVSSTLTRATLRQVVTGAGDANMTVSGLSSGVTDIAAMTITYFTA